MVKQISVTLAVPGCTVQEFDEIVFENLNTLREFHKREGEPHTVVPEWQDGMRVIRFSVPLTGVPDIVKTAIGTSTLTINETQCKKWSEEGGLVVTSEPILDIVGGSKFTTKAEFHISQLDAGSSCQITATVTCAAAGPWGLISTIEGIMAEQAEESVRAFLTFCAAKCAAAHEHELPALPDYASDADTIDLFQDAAESLASMPSVSGVDVHQLEPMLEALERHARGMQATIHSLCAALRSSSTASAPAKPVAAAALPLQASSWQYGYWGALLLAFLLGCCLGAFCRPRLHYMRA